MTALGSIVNDIAGMGATHDLIGGTGSYRWKQLINGMHLAGRWNRVEYVVLPPGSSCGAAHTIANHGDHDMAMYVIEVFPGGGEAHAPQRLPLGRELTRAAGFPTEPLELLSAEVYANSSEVA